MRLESDSIAQLEKGGTVPSWWKSNVSPEFPKSCGGGTRENRDMERLKSSLLSFQTPKISRVVEMQIGHFKLEIT